jgi:hypothetical protein
MIRARVSRELTFEGCGPHREFNIDEVNKIGLSGR